MNATENIIEERRPTEYGGLLLVHYKKGRLLGKGGFAKCYEVRELDTGKVLAAKIIEKATLSKSRTKIKLMREIQIQRSLNHPNIVRLDRYFEDPQHLYIIMELCPNKTLKEMLRAKRHFSESEARYYMKQLIPAVKYIHSQKVIHRDLKLGNLFLGREFEIKIGDFGLAAHLDFVGEKRRTICGTPNYIAPEVLNSRVKGHSYEADIWSIGVILYTLLIGKPPFETSNVKSTYKKIKENDYKIPADARISSDVKSLITKILVSEPLQRPTLDDILTDSFMSNSSFPLEKAFHFALPSHAECVRGNPAKILVATAGTAGTNKTLGLASRPIQSSTSIMPVYSVRKTERAYNIASMGYNTASTLSGMIKLKNAIITAGTAKKNPILVSTARFSTGFNATECPRAITSVQSNYKVMAMSNECRDSSVPRTARVVIMSAEATQRPIEVKIDYVQYYQDHTDKYGIGYLLTNGMSGFYYNDLTNMLWLEHKSKYAYCDFHSKTDKPNPLYVTEEECRDKDKNLKKKIRILKDFISSYGKFKENNVKAANSDIEEVAIRRIVKLKRGILFRLTNNAEQMIFTDNTEIILQFKINTLIYINKKGIKEIMKISSNLISANNEKFVRRYKYILSILSYLKIDKKNIVPNTAEPAKVI